MTKPFKTTPCSEPLHEWIDELAERRKDEPENLIREIKEGLRWLEAHGMTKEADEIWHEFYFGTKK